MLHIPVLLKETIEILSPMPGEFFIDATVGAGGHASSILEKINPGGLLLALDWDRKSLEKTKIKIEDEIRNKKLKVKIFWACGNYADLPEILKKEKLPKADGLLVDLGFSSDQIEGSGRGFSFRKDEPLDMRYGGEGLTAAEAVNSFSEKDLADIFYKYGEERFSRKIAKKIIEARKGEKILMTFQLVEIIKSAVPKSYERGRINPATRTFQAMRIYVNHELENLETLLQNLPIILKDRSRAAIISFHSLEDRLVKNYFREMAQKGRADFVSPKAEILIKKPIMASEEEIVQNPRARSAKLRAIKL